MNGGAGKLSLRERLEGAKRSRASSHAAAVALVGRFSELHPALLFDGSSDCDLMYGLTGSFWDELDSEGALWHYSGFCGAVRRAMEDGFEPPANLPWRAKPLELAWGLRASNALLLLGLLLMDNAKGRMRDKTICHCLWMTAEQYLDALETLAYPDRTAAPYLRFQAWRRDFCRRRDLSAPLADVLASVLRSYMEAWQELDHLNYLICCTGALACYLECLADGPLKPEEARRVRSFRETLCMYDPKLEGWELLEADRRFDNPGGYFFGLAMEYPDSLPDPGGSSLCSRAIRSQIFLTRESLDHGFLPLLADLAPSPDLGDLLRKYGDPERLAQVMDGIHLALSELYMLWVEPYQCLEELRGRAEKHPSRG